jgi:hypothetical protein
MHARTRAHTCTEMVNARRQHDGVNRELSRMAVCKPKADILENTDLVYHMTSLGLSVFIYKMRNWIGCYQREFLALPSVTSLTNPMCED